MLIFEKPAAASIVPINVPSNPWAFLLRLNQILTSGSSPEALMESVLKALLEIQDIESAWIGMQDTDGAIVPRAWQGSFSEALYNREIWSQTAPGPFGNGPTSRAWRSGQPEIVEDWRNEPGTAPWQALTADLNWQASASVPLHGHAGPIGILVIYSNTKSFFPECWPPEILVHLGFIIGNALAIRQKHAALQHAQILYRTLFQSADILLTANSEDQVMQTICKRLARNGLFFTATIKHVSPDGNYTYRAFAASEQERKLRNLTNNLSPRGLPEPFSVYAWNASKTVVSNYFATDPRFQGRHEAIIKAGCRAATAIPILRGGERWALICVSATQDNIFDAELVSLLEKMASLVGHALDEMDLKASLHAERETQSRIARQDALTLLPNRLAFEEHLEIAMARAKLYQNRIGVGIIDLDDFKLVNDNWGHVAGDAVLRVVGERLQAMRGPNDFVARLGGDEFALILEDWDRLTDINEFCTMLHETVNAPITLPDGVLVHISLSAGFALFEPGSSTPEILVRHADMALYEAKTGKPHLDKFWRLHVNSETANQSAEESRALLGKGALEVHYQPVMDLEDGKITGIEALARLRDGSQLYPPARFLQGLRLNDRKLLFQQVVEAGLKKLRVLDQAGIQLSLSVNVDAQILLLDGTLPFLIKILAASGIAPGRLVLEILETYEFVDLKTAKNRIEACRAHGIRIALDDLGVGYSSILKLRELPLDVVKLDRSFIARLHEKPDDLLFVSVMQTLTSTLGMELIVEGVETSDVLDALRMIGGIRAQGYVIARPMPESQLTSWLRQFRPPPASKEPATLLGAYALHSNWARLVKFWKAYPETLNYLLKKNPFSLDGFFAASGARHVEARHAYDALQALLRQGAPDRQIAQNAANQFRAKLIETLRNEAQELDATG